LDQSNATNIATENTLSAMKYFSQKQHPSDPFKTVSHETILLYLPIMLYYTIGHFYQPRCSAILQSYHVGYN